MTDQPQHQLTEKQRIQQAENDANGTNSPTPSNTQTVASASNADVAKQPEDNDPESHVGSPVSE